MFWGGTLTCLVVSVNIMIDTMIAGLFLEDKAVAGINLVTPLYDCASFFALLFSMGVPILYTSAMGRFDDDEANRVFGSAITTCIATGAIMCALAILFKENYLGFFGADRLIHNYAGEYLSQIPLLFLLIPFQNLICVMVFSDGDESLCLVSNIAEFLSKTLFSLLLVGRLGVRGLALSSVIGAAISITVCLFHFFREKNSLRMNLYFSWRHFISSAFYGLTDSSLWLFMALSSGILCKYITTFWGSEMLILASVVNLMQDLEYLFDGIGEAASPIMGIYHSEQCHAGIRKIWDMARKTAIMEGIFIAALCFIFADSIPRLLGISGDELSRYAVTGTKIICLSFPIVSLLYLLTSYYLILDRILLSSAVNFLRVLFFSVIFALSGSALWGVYGLFAGIALAPFVTWLSLVAYITLKYGKGAYPLLTEAEGMDRESFFFEFSITPEDIVSTRDDIEKKLMDQGFEKHSVLRAILLYEEIFMLIYERNRGTLIQAECSIAISGDILRLIGRDNGVDYDLSDEDMIPESLRDYVISRLASRKVFSSKHLIAMSFNRNMFEIKMKRLM